MCRVRRSPASGPGSLRRGCHWPFLARLLCREAEQAAGHFVKMIHNGIEYGVMAAYAEGLAILRHANAGLTTQMADAETAPMIHPEYYQYDLNLRDIAEVWRRGSVISSWLLDLSATAL